MSNLILQNVLTLTNLQRSDGGKWTVVANNSIGESTADIEVSIQYPATIKSITEMADKPVEPGQPIEIR